MSRALGRLGLLARQAITQTSEQAPKSAAGIRSAQTEAISNPATGRYSPNPFSRQAPLDRSTPSLPKNPYIEAWITRRDKFEREFSWTVRNTIEMAWMMLGVSAGFWAFSVWTVRQTDRRSHYPEREMVFSPTNTGFSAPDERDWY